MARKKSPPPIARQIAEFSARARFENLSPNALHHLKLHVLDTLGCAVGALGHPVTDKIRHYICEFPATGPCSVIGGGKTAPDRAVLMNSALVRYLDFMDNFLAQGETCHPCDNFGAVLAAAELARSSGREFLASLAVAYEVQCRLTEAAPIMRSGFDHTTQLAFSVATGVARALRLDLEKTTNAIAIGGVDAISLAVSRAAPVSEWKGVASADEAARSTQNVFLAARGLTGPQHVFEGEGGFMMALGKKFAVNWRDDKLEVLPRTLIKKFNAEVHTQSALEGVLELRQRHSIPAGKVQSVTIDIFKTAYEIVGGGKFGGKHTVRTKEDADHSLPYLAAVALLDGQVWPEQFAPERIKLSDVQKLLRKVTVRPKRVFTWQYPKKMACAIRVTLTNGKAYTIDKEDYEGFNARPMSWERVIEKFNRLTSDHLPAERQEKICDAVMRLEQISVEDLTKLLRGPAGRGSS